MARRQTSVIYPILMSIILIPSQQQKSCSLILVITQLNCEQYRTQTRSRGRGSSIDLYSSQVNLVAGAHLISAPPFVLFLFEMHQRACPSLTFARHAPFSKTLVTRHRIHNIEYNFNISIVWFLLTIPTKIDRLLCR